MYIVCMGELFRIGNRLKILVWPNDHDPAHVHVVSRGEGIEFKVRLADQEIEHLTRKQLSSRDEKMIVAFIKKNREFIQEVWDEIQKDQ